MGTKTEDDVMTKPTCDCWMVVVAYSEEGISLGRDVFLYEEENGNIYLWQEFIFKFCPICNKKAKEIA